MTYQEIISDLRSRGEYNIRIDDNGIIISNHGKSTINYWIEKSGELICIDCKTIYSFSI